MAGKDFLDFAAADRAADRAPAVKESRVVSTYSTAYEQEQGIDAPEDTRAYINFATKHSVIYRCVDRITRTVAGLPLKVYITDKTGRRTEAKRDDPVRRLLDIPNAHEPRYTFYWKMAQALETGGVSPVLIERNGSAPKELYILHPAAVRVVPDARAYIKGYKYKTPGDPKTYDIAPADMLYMKYPNPNSEYQPLSPLSAARDDIVLDLSAMTYNKALFKNRAVPAYALKTDQTLEPIHIKRLKKEVAQLFGGEGKAGKTMVLEAGLDWKQIQLSPAEVQWLEGRKMTREDICAIYGVPPVIAGIYDAPGANYANSREQEDLFWKLCIKPRLDFIEDWFNYAFLPTFSEGYSVEFLTNDILRVSPTDRNTIYKDAFMTARMTPNEIRAMENLPRIEDPAADKLYIPLNMVAIDTVANEPTPPAPKALDKGSNKKAAKKKPKVNGAALAKRRDKALAPIAKEFARKWLREIQADQTDIVRALRSAGKAFKANPADYTEDDLAAMYEEVFSASRTAEYSKLAQGYIAQSMDAGASAAADMTGVRFDMESARAMELIKTQSIRMADGTRSTMSDHVLGQLRAGLKAGEDIPTIADRINEFFNGMKEGKALEVARTETCAAYSVGSVEDYRAAGLEMKQWYFDSGAEDCPDGSCQAAADMGAIGIDEDFGEAGSEPPAHPNCTCAILPVFPGEG